VAGLLVILMGLERFTGKKGSQIHNYVLLAVFIAVSTYFVVIQPSIEARNIAAAAVIMIYTFQCSWLLLRRVDRDTLQVTRVTGVFFAGYAAASFIMIVLTIIFPLQGNDFFSFGELISLAITVSILLNIILTISLVQMVNRRLLADVSAQEEKFTRAFHSSPYAITLTKPSDGSIFEVNNGFVSVSGYEYSEIVGRTTVDLRLWVRDEDRQAVVTELAQGREVNGVEYQFRHKTGRVITGLFSANMFTINNETCILSSISDITERKRMEQELLKMATHDALTGLPNRALLYDRCGMALAGAQRNNKRVVIMSLDLDFFKNVNDLLGHDMGDRLLIATAERLTAALRKSDTVVRMGGDEFVLLLWEVEHKDDAVKVAEKILKDFRRPFLIDGHSLNVTISIGIAIYPENGDTAEALLKSSDRSLYAAKQTGRDRLVI
jgi:diguanylate cyclase (GGDEF)-like protein/PAS domain S-box-containing protein